MALAHVSAAVVAPFGIISVVIQAFLAESYLSEVINPKQRLGYGLMIAGILLILTVSPKAEPPLGSTVSQVLSNCTSFPFVIGSMLIFSILLYQVYQILIKKRENQLIRYVLVQSLFGTVSVIVSKILAVSLKVLASPVSVDDKATSELLVSSQKMGIRAQEAHSMSGGPLVLVCLILACAVSAEYFKQQALSRFEVSQVAPLSYACFTSIVVLSNVVLFREVQGFVALATFLSMFIISICIVSVGIRMVHAPPAPRTD